MLVNNKEQIEVWGLREEIALKNSISKLSTNGDEMVFMRYR